MENKKTILKQLILLQRIVNTLYRSRFLRPAFAITLLQLQKDINAARSFWSRTTSTSSLKKRMMPRYSKLQIGGGESYLQGFVNLDIIPPADIIWDSRYGLPFVSKVFEFVFSEHFLEHIDYPISVKKILREVYRVLKPNGQLMVSVPDAGKLINEVYSGKRTLVRKLMHQVYHKRNPPIQVHGALDVVNYLFRDQLENPKYAVHYWAYDEENLSNLLRSIGFRAVVKIRFNKRFCNKKRKFYSLYLLATK